MGKKVRMGLATTTLRIAVSGLLAGHGNDGSVAPAAG